MKEMCVTQCNDFDELITQMWREFFFFFSISLFIFLSLFFSRFLLNICGFSKKKKTSSISCGFVAASICSTTEPSHTFSIFDT